MFYASPLTLNPALTGINDGTYRVAGIYRNQWQSITTPYQTYGASFDIKILQNLLKNDIFGVGAQLVSDKSGDGKLSTTNAILSAAFHKGLDKDHKHFIGIGIQGAYTQMSLNWQGLSFPTQLAQGLSNFDPSTSGENISKSNFGYFDFHAGILEQSTIKDIVGFMTGFSVFHIVQPKESFLGQDVRLVSRFVVNEAIHIKITKRFYISPNFIYQYQNKAQEANFGAAFEYHVPTAKSEFVASLGGWYRATANDAAIISAGLEYYKIRAMFAYDINTSVLNAATNGRGAFEIAIIYTGIIKTKTLNYPVLVPCPMM